MFPLTLAESALHILNSLDGWISPNMIESDAPQLCVLHELISSMYLSSINASCKKNKQKNGLVRCISHKHPFYPPATWSHSFTWAFSLPSPNAAASDAGSSEVPPIPRARCWSLVPQAGWAARRWRPRWWSPPSHDLRAGRSGRPAMVLMEMLNFRAVVVQWIL